MAYPYKKTVTKKQYNNAQMHWEALIEGSIIKGFSMEDYINNPFGSTKEHLCGTCACSLGYVPLTVKIPFGELQGTRMDNYVSINYKQLSEIYLGLIYGSNEWEWCFSGEWAHVDNTPKGAGIRMYILYENGLPDNWEQQMLGNENLMYDVKTFSYDGH